MSLERTRQHTQRKSIVGGWVAGVCDGLAVDGYCCCSFWDDH